MWENGRLYHSQHSFFPDVHESNIVHMMRATGHLHKPFCLLNFMMILQWILCYITLCLGMFNAVALRLTPFRVKIIHSLSCFLFHVFSFYRLLVWVGVEENLIYIARPSFRFISSHYGRSWDKRKMSFG